MKIAVCGTGYVGLVVSACLADTGNEVTGVDIDPDVVERLGAGEVPIHEPGLHDLVSRNADEGRLRFTTEYAEAIPGIDLAFVCVDTPPAEDGTPRLDRTLAACRSVGRHLSDRAIVVMKSTVPVGTADRVREVITEETGQPFDVVSNPEFLKEGAAVEDFMKPDRVVVGTENPESAQVMRELYEPFVRTGAPILVMDNHSAELTKYASNGLLASRISFINEVANLADAVDADIHDVRAGMAADRRIGSSFLFAGVGYGGSCFPKDVQALERMGHRHGIDMRTARAAEETNRSQRLAFARRILDHLEAEGSPSQASLAVWGLSFKPRTDDMREAPSIEIVEALLEAGVSVRAFDPEATENARRIFGDRVELGDGPYDVLDGVDGLALVTEWNEFRTPDFERMLELMAEPVLFDGRNIWSREKMERLGFTYHGVGS